MLTALLSQRRAALWPSSRRRAFTLVELLVVIGIIALLISILLPTLSSARRSAMSVKCLSNERQLGQALVMFTLDHDNWLPKGWFNDTPLDYGGPPVGEDWGYRWPRWGWEDTAVPYLSGEGGSMELFLCPGDDTQLLRNVPDDGDPVWQPGGFYAEYEGDINNFPASYRYNYSHIPSPFRAIKINQLMNPTSAILILDATGVLGDPGNGNNWNQVGTWDGHPNANISEENMRLIPVDRHNEVPDGKPEQTKLNLAFADGHAQQFTWKETWEPMGERIQGAPANGTDFPTMWRQAWEPHGGKQILWNVSAGPALPGSHGR